MRRCVYWWSFSLMRDDTFPPDHIITVINIVEKVTTLSAVDVQRQSWWPLMAIKIFCHLWWSKNCQLTALLLYIVASSDSDVVTSKSHFSIPFHRGPTDCAQVYTSRMMSRIKNLTSYYRKYLLDKIYNFSLCQNFRWSYCLFKIWISTKSWFSFLQKWTSRQEGTIQGQRFRFRWNLHER